MTARELPSDPPTFEDPEVVNPFLLPSGVHPTRYDLILEPDLAAARFTGSVDIGLRLDGPARELCCNALDLTIDRAHVLLADGDLWAIDHGLCFHVEDKLRTVIWDFAGDPLTEVSARGLVKLVDEPPAELVDLISRSEIEALRWRAGALVEAGVLPEPDEDAPWPPYPWPLV